MPIRGLSKAAKSERDPESCYETPQWLVERIRAAFGGVIDLDPCTTPENPVGAKRFLTPAHDGILIPWSDGVHPRLSFSVYCNPPYGRTIRHWTDKAAVSSMDDHAKIILLLPARTDSGWWHDLMLASDAVIFMRGRIAFKGQSAEDFTSAPFPSALVGLNHDLAELADLGWRVKTA